MSFGLLNLTKQKKKPRNTTKCHTKKKFRNITKCHNIFVIFFISSCGRSQFDIILFNFYVHSIFTKNLRQKLLLFLKLCIKKKQRNKKTIQENCAWNVWWILAHPIWLYILKKKSKNTNKILKHFHNTFIFRIRIDIVLFYLREMLHP